MAKTSRKTSSTNRGSENSTAASGTQSKTSGSVQTGELMDLFEHGLKDILWAENALTKAIPKMAKKAQDQELKAALEDHLVITEGQIEKLEEVFKEIGKTARGKKCAGMEGIITEGEEIMAEFEGKLIDGAIVAASTKVEHYEISSYIGLIMLANELELGKSATLLQEILFEEQDADKKMQTIGKRLARTANQ